MKALRSLALIGAAIVMSSAFAAQASEAPKATKKSAPQKETARASVPPPLSLVMANPEQLLASTMAFVGDYACEFNQVLVVNKSQVEGYFDVLFNKDRFTMKPVRSATGALRFEQVGGPMLLVQIPAKSMLMDTEKGKRVVDGCVSAEQAKEVAVENSLDMNLPGQVNTVANATAATRPKR